MAQIVDSYNLSDSIAWTLDDNIKKIGQSFTNTSLSILNSCIFKLSKKSTPTGNINACIYAHSGTYGVSSLPTGTALATSDTINVSMINNGDNTFIFSGANKIILNPSTYYVVTLEYSDGTSSNGVYVFSKNVGTHSGNPSMFQIGFNWSVGGGTYDNYFYVYKDDPIISPFPSFKRS